jgi:hypothetical protein
VLSRAGEFFELSPARIPAATKLALRRAAQRRGKTIVDANRCLRRVISQARWAFPDVWNAFAGVTAHRARGAGPLAASRRAGPGPGVLGGVSAVLCKRLACQSMVMRPGKWMASALSAAVQPQVPVPSSPPLSVEMRSTVR